MPKQARQGGFYYYRKEENIMAIKLSTGKVKFPIEFDNGTKDAIYFNPNDPDLMARFIGAKDKISQRVQEMNFDDIELNNDGEPVQVNNVDEIFDLPAEKLQAIEKQAEQASKAISEAKRIICEELDRAFDSNVSEVLFRYCSPLGIVDGNYYIIHVLNALTPEIQKHATKANAQADEKMKKHLNKYGYGK
jgi:hypothetical protein